MLRRMRKDALAIDDSTSSGKKRAGSVGPLVGKETLGIHASVRGMHLSQNATWIVLYWLTDVC
jgi:hypothetical protein